MNIKSFGQHYLENEKYLLLLIESAELKKEDVVLEVGAGDGRITKRIAQQVKKVVSYEIDNSTKNELQEVKNEYYNVEIYFENFLKVKKLCKIDKVVASLPYQITEPFIEKIKDIPCQSITLIVGATFAKNVTNTFLHSKLALLTNCYFSAIKICDVPEDAFLPPPKTLSSIIKLIPKSKKELVDEGGLYIFREIFEQRDKKIKNALQYSIIRFYNIKGILLTKRKCKKILKEYLVTLRREDIALEQMTNKEIVAMYKYICSVAESVNYFVQIS